MQRRTRSEAASTAGARHLDVLRSPAPLSRLPSTAPQPQDTRVRKPRDNSPALRSPPPQLHIPPKPPRIRRNQTMRTPSPGNFNITFGSDELLRSSSATNLTQHPRPRTHLELPDGLGIGPGRNLQLSQSCDHVPLLPPPATLDEACRNISHSNRSLVETLSREVVGICGTVPLSVQRLPGNRHDVPVYLIGDDADDDGSPTLLQRSKTFICERAAIVRKSFRSRSNSNVSRPAPTTPAPAPAPAPAIRAKMEPNQNGRISLVFGVRKKEAVPSAPPSSPKCQRRKKNSFREFRKRFFSK